ncbi:MAG TPA: hypothetical protein VGJ32_07900 [Solirubrobacteraceae bacterium]|jgi:hypothetical protein
MDPESFATLVARASGLDQHLLADLVAGSWPGGPADHTQPVAREWLRRWAPKRLTLEPPACSCPQGRCRACN